MRLVGLAVVAIVGCNYLMTIRHFSVLNHQNYKEALCHNVA